MVPPGCPADRARHHDLLCRCSGVDGSDGIAKLVRYYCSIYWTAALHAGMSLRALYFFYGDNWFACYAEKHDRTHRQDAPVAGYLRAYLLWQLV